MIIFLFAALLLLTGCGAEKPTVPTEPAAPVEPVIHSLREEMTPVEGYANLYHCPIPDGEEKTYVDILAMGDYILLVGTEKAGSEELPEDAKPELPDVSFISEEVWEPEGDDWDAPAPDYFFDLYDPSTNSIIASLPAADYHYAEYRVLGDRLLVIDAPMLTVYDNSLQLVDTFDISTLCERTYLGFYAGEDGTACYSCDFYENRILKINTQDFSFETIDLGMYQQNPAAISPNGRYLAVNCMDDVYLKHDFRIVDISTGDTVYSASGQSYYGGYLSDHSFVAASGSDNLWLWADYSGDTRYFSLSGIQNCGFMPDDTLLAERWSYNSELTNSTITCFRYAPSGKVLSSFSWVLSDSDYGTGSTLVNRNILSDDTTCVMLHTGDAASCAEFLVWDLSTECNSADLSISVFEDSASLTAALAEGSANSVDPARTPSEEEDIPTPVTDPEHYAWGKLKASYLQSCEMEKDHGVSIFIGPEIPDSLSTYNCEQQLDPDLVEGALDKLDTILDRYPENFFPQLCFGDMEELRIYLAGALSGDTEGMIENPGGYVYQTGSRIVMVMDVSYSYDWDYMINHELSHMIDRRLDYESYYRSDMVYSDTSWQSQNPEDFEYLYTYSNYFDSPFYEKYPEYFIDSYGTTYSTEDRAEVFGQAMSVAANGYDWGDYFKPDSPIYTKLEYYSACIRDGFDTEGWPDVLPWESVLN